MLLSRALIENIKGVDERWYVALRVCWWARGSLSSWGEKAQHGKFSGHCVRVVAGLFFFTCDLCFWEQSQRTRSGRCRRSSLQRITILTVESEQSARTRIVTTPVARLFFFESHRKRPWCCARKAG